MKGKPFSKEEKRLIVQFVLEDHTKNTLKSKALVAKREIFTRYNIKRNEISILNTARKLAKTIDNTSNVYLNDLEGQPPYTCKKFDKEFDIIEAFNWARSKSDRELEQYRELINFFLS